MRKLKAFVIVFFLIVIVVCATAPASHASEYLGELCLYISFGVGSIPTPYQFGINLIGGGHVLLSGRFYPLAMTVPVTASLEFTTTEAIIGYSAAYVLSTSGDAVSETGLISIDLDTLDGTADVMQVRYSSPTNPSHQHVSGSVTVSPCPM